MADVRPADATVGAADDVGADLRAALRRLACDQDRTVSYGTHSIFIGRVREVFHDRDVDPLIYMDGRYRAISQFEDRRWPFI